MSLSVDSLGVAYAERVALAPCSLDFPAGELVALVGPNGAGKTSLLKAVAGLVPATGTVSWRGRDVARFTARERARTMAYLPQAPEAHWPMTVRDLVALGRLPHGASSRRASEEDLEAVEWAMRCTELEGLAHRPVDALSGGERARALLARALAVRAPLLLVDEPVTSLDPYHQLGMMNLLRDYASNGGPVVAILHDLTLAARYSSRVVLMSAGIVVATGAPAEVLKAANLERHYRTTAYVAHHEGQPVIVPWRRLDR